MKIDILANNDYNLTEEILGHQVRVSLLAKDFCKHIKTNPGSLAVTILSSQVHDIGKFSIPKEVLLKKGSLNKEDIMILHSHSMKSAEELIRRKTEKSIVEAVKHHHESYDGSGYPCGLIGDEIPFESRIIKLCDVYDAITNKRIYRKVAYSSEEALKIMNNMKNEFDPSLFLAFRGFIIKENKTFIFS